MQVVPNGGGQQTRAETALLEDPIRPLEHGHTRVGERRRMDDDAVAVDQHAQPILDAADHDRDHRAHVVCWQTLASRRCRPRSTASAAATAWATENETVQLIDTPR